MRVQGTSSAEHSVLRDIRMDPVAPDFARDDPIAATGDADGHPHQADGHPHQAEQTTVRVELEVPPPVADVALVVVHGMGRQQQGEALLEWAEPILGRIDWLTKRTDKAAVARAAGDGADAVAGAEEFEPGVAIVDSVMRGATTPHVLVEAAWRTPDLQINTRTIAVVEARWAESFVPMSRTEVFSWGVRFLWRSLYRMFRQFFRTMVGVPWLAMTQPRGSTSLVIAARMLLGALTLVFGTVLTAAIAVVLAVLGTVLSAVLPLLSPLMLIPIVKKFSQSIVDVLVDFVGDVGTFREKPLRAAAMRVVLHDALAHANTLIEVDDGEIAVLAHSQGAAISAVALFHELDLSTLPVKRLATVGAAITLLGTSMWHSSPTKEAYKPITNWVKNAPTIRWDNYWAIWDPFSAGPVGDSFRARLERWKSCYRPVAISAGAGSGGEDDEQVYFPGEHAVHNTSMPFTDHQSYADNIVQVVEPIAIELLGPQFPPIPAQMKAARNTRVIGIRRGRGAMLVAAVIIAVLLPTQTWFLAAVGATSDAVLAVLHSGLHWAGIELRLTLEAIYTGGTATFTLLGTVLLAALVAAVLIWLIGWFTTSLERRIVWDGDLSSSPHARLPHELVAQAVVLFVAAALVLAAVVGVPFDGLALVIAIGISLAVLLFVHTGQRPVVAPGHSPPVPDGAAATNRMRA